MKNCDNCFYSKTCKAFDELKVSDTDVPCENHLDKSMVIVLPCPIKTTVYERYKDCEHCPNYYEAGYSDYVCCNEDNELYSFSPDEKYHDDERECLNHIKIKEVQFNPNMITRYGKDIFLTENVIFVNPRYDLITLQGYTFGKFTFNDIKNNIDYNKPLTIVFPDRIEKIGTSFIDGFFYEIADNWGPDELKNKMHIISKIDNLKEKIIDVLQ